MLIIAFTIYISVYGMFVDGKEMTSQGLLYPRESETREVKTLDGVWNFLKSDIDNPARGLREEWYKRSLKEAGPVIKMPVPSSYNDITESASLRDHLGTVWYDREFFVPKSWNQNDQKVWIRFGSVHYAAQVWMNGKLAVQHQIGHLPFEAEITDHLKFGVENRVTVICDNVLLQTTIPQGKVVEQPVDDGVEKVQTYTFDFFNYAGIHRSVILYTTPNVSIQDVTILTDIKDTNGFVKYDVEINSIDRLNYRIEANFYAKNGSLVASDTSTVSDLRGIAEIKNVVPWWPYLMNEDPGYLYTIELKLIKKSNEAVIEDQVTDVYRMKFGIRTLTWNNKEFLINGKPIYFRGFGRHEDSDIRGKGLDYALLTKDFNLLKWVGANAYRTSHYPYSEESMQFADEYGIMIIDECPSVDTENYSQQLLDNHKSSIEQLIHRDKNYASAVMWSIANEPRTALSMAGNYFAAVASYTKKLDPTRPITAAIAVNLKNDNAAKSLDIVGFNRYNAWYENSGRLNMIRNNVVEEAKAWNQKHNKLVMMLEYGADTMEGLHILPAYIWSEDYQTAVFSKHFEAFDQLRQMKFFIGEFVWNFADFKTAQTYTRVGGNKKGIFTRNRQPKAAAYHLRRRYYELARELDHATLPNDLHSYTSNNASINSKTEL